MESFLNNLYRNTQPSQPWLVRVPAKIINGALVIACLPLLVVVVLPLLLVVGVPVTVAGWIYDGVWSRPKKVRRLQDAGRVISPAECLPRWRAGEGTILIDSTMNGWVGAWWTPDRIEPPSRELSKWMPANDRAEAEKWAEASIYVARLRKQYIDPDSGSALYVRGFHTNMRIKPLIEAPDAGRSIELFFSSNDNAHWWWYAASGGCRECGYSLAGLPKGSRCPECGTEAAGDRSLGR